MIPSGAETGRSVYQMSLTAADTELAQDVISRIFCPDPNHAPPCPIPWESSQNSARGTVRFVFYATDDQAQEVLAEVITHGLDDTRLFRSSDADGQVIDGSTVLGLFRLSRIFPALKSDRRN